MTKRITWIVVLLWSSVMLYATWSFSGGFVYFDNSQTQWNKNIYLIIGKSTYSSVYPMTLNPENPQQYVASLPKSGWADAEYMAVISSSDWKKGNFGYSELQNASAYTAAYTAGLTATDNQRFLLTPASANNGAELTLSWLGNDQDIRFSDEAKNNCQLLDSAKGLVTLIFSTSSKRQNISSDDIERVYINGSISAWNDSDPHYILPVLSSDGCFFGTFPISDLQRRGNSGQPEFVFHVVKKDGSDYTTRAYSNWQGPIDERLVFENNGQNMLILLPGDEIEEINQRRLFAKSIAKLSDFDLQDSASVAHLTNFRRVPATRHLYRSYHPYKPDRAKYETEHERMTQLALLGAQYGIQSDIALSGNESSHAGDKYTCGGNDYKVTIPSYYQSIIDNHNVLYVGTANGHTPDYQSAVFFTNGERFGEWIQEVVRFVGDSTHPAPFQIHCSLGADRTGAFSAVLAALCGASWQQIAADYHETSNLRIQEYRHSNCVRYELYLLTGEWPESFAPVSPKSGLTLGEAVAKHFVDGGYLTETEIEKAVQKLRGESITTSLKSPESSTLVSDKLLRSSHVLIRHQNTLYTLLGTPCQ